MVQIAWAILGLPVPVAGVSVMLAFYTQYLLHLIYFSLR